MCLSMILNEKSTNSEYNDLYRSSTDRNYFHINNCYLINQCDVIIII